MLMCASDLAPEHEGHAVVEGAHWQADLRTRKGMVKRTFREKQTALTSKNIHLSTDKNLWCVHQASHMIWVLKY